MRPHGPWPVEEPPSTGSVTTRPHSSPSIRLCARIRGTPGRGRCGAASSLTSTGCRKPRRLWKGSSTRGDGRRIAARLGAWTALGWLFEMLGRRIEARQQFLKALDVDKAEIWAKIGLADLSLLEGAADAEALFRAVLARVPGTEALELAELGWCHLRLGECAQAGREFAEALRLKTRRTNPTSTWRSRCSASARPTLPWTSTSRLRPGPARPTAPQPHTACAPTPDLTCRSSPVIDPRDRVHRLTVKPLWLACHDGASSRPGRTPLTQASPGHSRPACFCRCRNSYSAHYRGTPAEIDASADHMQSDRVHVRTASCTETGLVMPERSQRDAQPLRLPPQYCDFV